MSIVKSIWKKSRALSFSLLENKKEFSRGKKRTYGPGIHGNKKKRKSDYALQNTEKQKARFLYGWTDKQLHNQCNKQKQKPGNVVDNLMILCESRLDNVIYRAGIGTRLAVRKWITQNHFLVDGEKVKTPSYILKEGQTISFRKEKMINNPVVREFLEQNLKNPSYINFDKVNGVITFIRKPSSEEINVGINFQTVLEWYNRKK